MNLDVLILQTNRLFLNYSPEVSEKKREEKISFFRQELTGISEYQFKTAVDEIIKDVNIKKFPTIAQIRGYIPRNNSKAEEMKDCDHCHGGIAPVWQFKESLKRHYQFAYACPFCEAGRVKQKTFPLLPIEYHSIPFEVLRKNPECQTN